MEREGRRKKGSVEGGDTLPMSVCACVCLICVCAAAAAWPASGEQSTVRAPLQPLPPLVFVIVFKLPGQQQQQQQQLGTIPHGQWASALRKVLAAAEERGSKVQGEVRTQAKVLAKCSRREGAEVQVGGQAGLVAATAAGSVWPGISTKRS